MTTTAIAAIGRGDAVNRLTTPVERSVTTIEKRLIFKPAANGKAELYHRPARR